MKKYYYVIERNISRSLEHAGKKYIIHKGMVYEYGIFTKANGFEDPHKADLELIKARKNNKNALSFGAHNRCEYYIEERTEEEIEK